ncbi:MAG: hypothetical protein OEW11_08550 [Nitrospirota bacterium]|nr:hypothetical protein [Nitrospirota bacterium]
MFRKLTFATVGLALVGLALAMPTKQAHAQAWPNATLPAEDVKNTKHNFFRNPDIMVPTAAAPTTEICVFCHTPHGGRTDNAAAPLWNRALPASAGYTLYSSPNFNATALQPQGVSLACLSCHDGTIGIDALINAPGSGGFLPGNKTVGGTVTSMGMLTPNTLGVGAAGVLSGALRNACGTATTVACFQTVLGPQTASQFFAGADNTGAVPTTGTWGMAPFPNLTKDLSDDHPISIQIPTTDPQFAEIIANFNKPAGSFVTYLNRNSALEADYNTDIRDRIRAYPDPTTGTTGEFVECASCHNPHTPRPLFLRLPNVKAAATGLPLPLPSGGGVTAWAAVTGVAADTQNLSNNPNFQSAICLSCHQK